MEIFNPKSSVTFLVVRGFLHITDSGLWGAVLGSTFSEGFRETRKNPELSDKGVRIQAGGRKIESARYDRFGEKEIKTEHDSRFQIFERMP